MKKSEIWEGVILLLSAVLLLVIWMASTEVIQLPQTLVKVLSYSLVIVLGIILVRRLRRVIRAFRENKNKPGPF